jgi:putative oxidoreductase
MWLIRTPYDRAAFVARLALGVVMFPHGAQKALGWFGGEGFRATIEAMGQQGIPVSGAVLIMMGELLGGLALVVGLLGRVAAASIATIMLGAIFLVHAQYGFFMNWTGTQPGEGFEYHLLALGLALVVLVKGSGALSIDRALGGDDEALAFEPAHVGLTAPDVDGVPSRGPEATARR